MYYVIVQLLISRLIKMEMKWLIVEVKYSLDFTEKKRDRIRNQMRSRLKSNLSLSFQYLFYASQRAK